MKNKISKMQRRTNLTGLLFIMPNLLGFLVFIALPLIFSFFLSFNEWDAITDLKFVGLDNYIELFKDKGFRISLLNTCYYTAVSVPLTLVAGLILAVAINTKVKLSNFYQTVFFMPNIVSMVAAAVVFQAIYHPTMGPINMLLSKLGVMDPPKWTSDINWAMPSIIIMSIWKNAGYYMVIYFAALQDIPRSLYEAADIDGAGTVKKFFKITLPMLSPTTFFVTIISIISSFKVFDQVFLLTDGGPGRATNVLVYYIYKNSFSYYKFGYASASAYVLFFIILVLTIIQYRMQRKTQI
jgi:ABC-type sugar transport system permease subunit